MRLKYTQQAIADLASIANYHERLNPQVLPRIRSDIEAKLELIKAYPESGHQQQDETVRKAVTRRYRYIIHYRILRELDELQVLAIRHFRQAQLYKDN